MKKPLGIATTLFFVFFIFALVYEGCDHEKANMLGYAKDIERSLHKQEKEITEIFSNSRRIWVETFEPGKIDNHQDLAFLENLKGLSEKPFSILFYLEDSLVFWNQNIVIPPKEVIAALPKDQKETGKLIKLSNGYYEIMSQPFDPVGKDIRMVVALIPIKNAFKLESRYLENWFVFDHSIPHEVDISTEKTDFPVRNYVEKKPLFYLSAAGRFKDIPHQKTLLIIYLISFLCFAVVLNELARAIVKKYRPWWGAAFLIAVIALMRAFSLQWNFTEKFDSLAIFNNTFNTKVLNYSLGDLLIDILLLLWLMVFFHREFKVKQFVNISTPWQFFLTTLNYFSIVLGILMVTSVFKSLVMDSGITFDFDNVFQLDVYSILSIFGVIFLMFALFLFSHRMMLTIQKIGLSKRLRLLSLLSSLLIAVPVMLLTDLGLPFTRIIMVASLYLLLFDLYIDEQRPSLVWLGTWLVFFASFAAVLLFKYNEDKDLVTRLEYAKELAKWEDPYAEEEFERLTSMLEEDPLIVKLLFSDSLQRAASLKQLEKQIDNVYSNHSYLFNIYSYSFAIEVAGDTTAGKTRFLDADKNISYFTDKLSQAKATKYPDIFYWTAPQQLFSYLSPIFISDPNNPKKGVFIYFEIQKRLREPSMVYTELILTQSYKKLDNLFRYDYAIYQNDNLVEQNDIVYDTKISGYPVPLQGTGKEEIFGNRSEFGYHAPDGTVVILGRQVRSLLKPISLFSYVFLLLLVTVVLIAVVNTFAKVLPEVLQLTIWQKPSLKTKIQLSIITVIVASFIMIGWVTVVYFRNTSNEYHETRLLRRLNSVLLNIEHEIQLKSELGEEEPDFEKMIKEINPIHRMDINIFDLQGNLVTSTEMDIFNKGIVGKKMGGVAYHAMARQNQVEFIQEEKIGMFDYKAAYVPLRGATGKVMGYVGLPYYTKQRNLRDDVYEFMGTLLNVYVFLLLIATTIAIFVANSITKPIAVIGDRFKRFKLGSHEPLVWNSRDELGELIDDYNRMIQKVMDSTEKLKQSEREGAWRTMAQQVAHEIKNPLTPMKLSIQYLQHALKNDPEKAQPLFDKVARTLTEQIESLSQIATAFSDFAKMPKPENHPLNINELVKSVQLLFAENTGVDFEVNLPEKSYTVFADKNQLIRVFNNLISNAIQAIPDDRQGKIVLSVFEKDETVIVKVSDNGKGIPEEMYEKVFAPHFTTKSSGMGLGLAMCKDIIEKAGGLIYFKTVLHKGTDFFVELPIMQPGENGQES